MALKRKSSFNPKSFLSEIGEGRSIKKYKMNQVVFSQGDPADAVFYVLKGQVKVAIVSEQGKEAIIAIHGANSFFGQRCLAGQPRRIATVTALTESRIMRLGKAVVLRAIHLQPEFSEFFIAHLLDRHIRVEADLIDHLFNSSEKRLARLLLVLANFDRQEKGEPVNVKISQKILAEKIGTTRSRVSVFLNKFQKLGFIDYNRSIRVHSSLLSMILHDQPRLEG